MIYKCAAPAAEPVHEKDEDYAGETERDDRDDG